MFRSFDLSTYQHPFCSHGGSNLLVSHLHEYQPSVVPATIAFRVVANFPFRIVQAFAAEGVVPSQAAEFIEKVV